MKNTSVRTFNSIAVITGKDNPGILSEVTKFFANKNADVIDLSNLYSRNYVTIMILLHIPKDVNLSDLRDEFVEFATKHARNEGRLLGIKVSLHEKSEFDITTNR